MSGETAASEVVKLAAGEGVLRSIPIAALVESKNNPRRSYDPATMKELTESVRQHGIIQPLTVRAVGDSAFEIVAGSRRYRAAKTLRLAFVPALVRVLTDEQVSDIRLIENLQRDDLVPLDEALGYKALVKRGQSIEQIATSVGKSESYVYQRLKLSELTPDAQKALRDTAGFTAAHGVQIARLQARDQGRALDYCLGVYNGSPAHRAAMRAKADRIASVRDLARFIAADIHLDLNKAPFPVSDALLVEKAGACTTCPKRTGFNKALFADIAKEDTCTDATCYHEKEAAFVQIKVSEVRGDHGPTPLVVSRDYRTPASDGKGGKPLAVSQYVTISKKGKGEGDPRDCALQRPAVIGDGPAAGHTVTVCADQKCATHWRTGHKRYNLPPSGAKQNKAQADKLKFVRAVRSRVLDRVLAAPPKLGPLDVPLVALALFEHLPGNIQKIVYARHDWKPIKEKTPFGSFAQYGGPMLYQRLRRLTGAEVGRFVIELCCTPDAEPGLGDVQRSQPLTPPLFLGMFARRAKVPYGSIERQVRQEIARKGVTKRRGKGKPKTRGGGIVPVRVEKQSHKLHTSAKSKPKGGKAHGKPRSAKRSKR